MCLSRLAQILYAVVCALVVCFILVSTFTTEWSVATKTASDRTWSRYDRKGSVGLLRECVDDICAKYDTEMVPDWMNGVLACMILALIVAIGAFIWDCVTFCACCCRDYLLQPLPVLASLCALLLCIAVIIYGVKHNEAARKAPDTYEWQEAEQEGFKMDVGYGYSFYMAIVAIILSLINVVIGALGVCCADQCEPI
ncbi:Protein CLC-1 [Aphelenchoides avenae]|nr:Protein CLC-1 [Aphelenchus avenae]